MIKIAQKFIIDEEGAVTVDWVVLTAAIIFIAISAFTVIKGGSDGMADDAGVFLTEIDHDALRNPNR
ncbi:MAG: hypothetical protein V7661_09285 [Sulfitobacter sp.]